QQIKQPEAGCSLLETRFATSSKNHAVLIPFPEPFLVVQEAYPLSIEQFNPVFGLLLIPR
ncbi:hypothetical protein, partial [Chlorobium phaeovibrioides]|uniref:hypothetical protein n=1 Tax=Chlorobium phaeovibrioides TaxID=1094 RepID=UPI001C8BECA4